VLDQETEAVILQTLSRTRRSSACFYLLVVLTVLALPNGPRLSTSPTFSVAMAVLVSLAVLAPYCLLRQVLAPFSEGGSGPTREVDLDDYVSPTRRVVFWIAGLGSLAIPVVFVVLAQSDTYDGSRLYWAGLSALPLSCAAVVIELEVRMGALRDQGADAWTLYLRDALRTRALRRVWTFGAAAAAIAWDMASDVLVGVGVEPSPPPHWVVAASNDAHAVSVLLGTCACYFWLAPTRRFRRRLWPFLTPAEKMAWERRGVPSPT
jgi:hypothetical protein